MLQLLEAAVALAVALRVVDHLAAVAVVVVVEAIDALQIGFFQNAAAA